MTVNLSMFAGAGAQFFDNSGNPLSGGKLLTYAAGTTTPQTTYTTVAGNVAHTNPIILDSAGRISAGGEIWLSDAVNYKFVLTNANDVLLRTYDDITGNGSGIFAALAAPSGSSLVGFLQAGTGAVATIVQAKLRETVSVKDFGAMGDGVTDDTAAIQAAIDFVYAAGGGTVLVPTGVYLINAPLSIISAVSLIGKGQRSSIIRKTTNTVASGSATARGGAVTDSFSVDSIIELRHGNNSYSNYILISEITLEKSSYAASSYGVYAPRADHIELRNVYIANCQTGYYTFDTWMSEFTNVYVYGAVTSFQWANDSTGFGTGTSCTFTRCWSRNENTVSNPAFGFNIFGLTYSAFINCAVEKLVPLGGGLAHAFFFLTCNGITLTSCGTEASASSAIYALSSVLMVNGHRTFQMSGNTSGTLSTIFADASQITLSSCRFEATSPANSIFNWVIQNGASVIELNPQLSPSGGNTFVSYSSGASRTRFTSGTIQVFDSTGTKANAAFLDANSLLPAAAFYTTRGQVSATAGVPINIGTVSTGSFTVYVWVNSSGTNYMTQGVVTCDGATAVLTSVKAGANLVLSISGLDVRVTSSVASGVNYTILRQT